MKLGCGDGLYDKGGRHGVRQLRCAGWQDAVRREKVCRNEAGQVGSA